MGHIELAKWADIILIAPCTAETIAKITHGRADDLMGAIILASKASVFIAPAMNMNMWLDQSTQENCKKLVTYGYKFLGPTEGLMACGEFGKGKMLSPKKIFKEVKNDIGKEIPKSGNLENWANQGVLLLNTALTVRQSKANSHSKIWSQFTKLILKKISEDTDGLIFTPMSYKIKQLDIYKEPELRKNRWFASYY